MTHIFANHAAGFGIRPYIMDDVPQLFKAASSAARLCARFSIQELGLQRIEILVATGNIASQRVAVKSGTAREGALRNRLNYHGRFHDAVVFSFIPPIFPGAEK